MSHVRIVVPVLLALGLPAAAQDAITFSDWEAWNAFKEGSSVTYKYTSAPGLVTITIAKKEADKITLHEKSSAFPDDEPRVRTITREGETTECRGCAKPLKTHKAREWTDKGAEKFKVGDKEYAGRRADALTYGCDGAKLGVVEFTLCKDVPGWVLHTRERISGQQDGYWVHAFSVK